MCRRLMLLYVRFGRRILFRAYDGMAALAHTPVLPEASREVRYPPNCDVHSGDRRWQLYVGSSRRHEVLILWGTPILLRP